jgi:hypothetical protein
MLLAVISGLGFWFLAVVSADIGSSQMTPLALTCLSLLSYSFFCWLSLKKFQNILNKNIVVVEGGEPIRMRVKRLRNTLIMIGFLFAFMSVFLVFG